MYRSVQDGAFHRTGSGAARCQSRSHSRLSAHVFATPALIGHESHHSLSSTRARSCQTLASCRESLSCRPECHCFTCHSCAQRFVCFVVVGRVSLTVKTFFFNVFRHQLSIAFLHICIYYLLRRLLLCQDGCRYRLPRSTSVQNLSRAL